MLNLFFIFQWQVLDFNVQVTLIASKKTVNAFITIMVLLQDGGVYVVPIRSIMQRPEHVKHVRTYLYMYLYESLLED